MVCAALVGLGAAAASAQETAATAELTGLPAGPHGFHIHTVGACEPPFQSAGGHFNPDDRQHGIENPKGKHAGDLPNIHVPAQAGRLHNSSP
jgi:Cu-Zn family superoxide dismutase